MRPRKMGRAKRFAWRETAMPKSTRARPAEAKRRSTDCTHGSRSAFAWKVATTGPRAWRSAWRPGPGTMGSCTWTTSNRCASR
ncbi:hypothetical protein PSR1_04314 [Anaeromyxobacter sp. PSR-1]|nr:hypothetical protein PSR1_04314 [Anaeromyxobacter sp. PSR-1]